MNKIKEKIDRVLKKQLEPRLILNIVLYSILIVMPFIVTNVSGPRYVIGKVYFLYLFTLFAIIISFWCGRFKLNKIHILSLIFLITIFISAINSPYRDIAFWGNYDRSEGFVMLFTYIALFIISSKYIICNEKLLTSILIAASCMAIYGIIQFYGIDPIQKFALGEIKVKESIGTIGHRNFFSTYLSLFIYISMSMYILNGNKKYLIFSSFLFSGLLCTLTRGGWLAFIIYSFIGGVFFIRKKSLLKRALVVIIIFSSLFIIINITSGGKIISRADKSVIVSDEGELQGSAGARVDILKLTWQAFKDSPILGYGPDTLNLRLSNDYPEAFIMHSLKYNELIDKAHNEYLEYAVSNGIFTLITYLILLITIFIGLIKNINENKFKVMLLTLIGYLVQAFLNISVIMVAPLFWIFLGYCVQSIYKNKYKDITNNKLKIGSNY